MTEKPVLNVDDLAKYLGVSKTLVYQEAAAGKIPCKKIGGRLVFHRETIEKWIKGA